MTRCSYPGCSQVVHARGLCGRHYQRAWQTKTLPPLAEFTVWFWTCSHCGVRSFATFATAAEAERYCERHEAGAGRETRRRRE